MHLLDQRILGIIMVFLLVTLVIVKRMATGSIFDKPGGNLVAKVASISNLFFLLIANLTAAVLLITRFLENIDPTHMTIDE